MISKGQAVQVAIEAASTAIREAIVLSENDPAMLANVTRQVVKVLASRPPYGERGE